MSTIRGLTVEIGADTTQFGKAMDGIWKNTKDLNTELRDVNRSLRFDTKNPELLAQKTKILNERFNETSKKLDIMKQSQDKVNRAFAEGKLSPEEHRKFHSEVAITTSQLEGFEKQLKEARKEMLKYDGDLGKVATKLENTGDKMTEAGKKMAPLSAITGAATIGFVKAASDWESAWAGVMKVMPDDATAGQIDAVKEGVRGLARELPYTAVEIAAVTEEAGKLGVGADDMLVFTRTMLDMGVATDLTTSQAATDMARFANIMKMPISQVDKLGSVMVDMGNNFATTEPEIISMALRLAAAGKQVGMAEHQVIALATAMSTVGIEAQAGGSAMSKLMINMELATQTGEGLQGFLDVTNMSASEFTDVFQNDAAGAIVSFIDGLAEIDAEGGSVIKVLDDMNIKEVRMRDTILRLTNANDELSGAMGRGSAAWNENTALTEEAQIRYDTFASTWASLKSKFEDVAITMGEHLMPHIEKGVEWLGKMVDKFGALNPGTQSFIAKTVALTAVAAPLLIVLGKTTSGLGSLVGGISAVGKASGLLKVSGAGASAALGSIGTGAAGATGSVGLFGGAMAGIGPAVGAAATAAAPFVAAGAAIAGAGYLVHKALSEEAIPSVDLFEDSLDRSSVTVDEYGNLVGAKMIQISEETKESLGAYIEMSDGVQEQFTRMYVGLDEITALGINDLKVKTNEMVDSIIEKNSERKDKELEIIQGLYGEGSELTKENQAEINKILSEDYDQREKKTLELKTELSTIYDDMANNAEGGTQKQKDRVEEILKELTESAADVMTQSAVEREVIMQKYNAYEGRVTAEQASKIIGELEEQKNETIGKAEETKAEQIRIAEELRAKGGEKAEASANKIIKEANRQYDEQVKFAEKGKTDAVDKLIGANSDLANSIDKDSGKIKTRWDNLKTWWNNLKFGKKTAQVEEVYTGTGQKHNNGLLNVPYNGYQAILHRNERVLTASENAQLKDKGFLDNQKIKEAANSVANIDNSVVNNMFTLAGTYHVREEADINKIAKNLHNLTLKKGRA